MLKTVMKSSVRILACVAVVALLAGMGCINSLMFHTEACKGGYGESTEGYVDIGTNGVKIAAIVLGPERGKKAILRCHGNAEDAANSLFALRYLARRGFTVACVDYPGYGLSDGSPDEDGCYRNVHRLYDWLIEKRGFKPEDIIVDGFSIGSGLGGAVPFRAARGDANTRSADRSIPEPQDDQGREVPRADHPRDEGFGDPIPTRQGAFRARKRPQALHPR